MLMFFAYQHVVKYAISFELAYKGFMVNLA